MNRPKLIFRLGACLSFIFVLSCLSCQQSNSNDNTQGPLTTQQQELAELNRLVETQPQEAEGYYQRGQYYHDFTTYSEAVRDLIRCTELDSSRVDCWHLLADSYMDDNRSRLAIETLEDLLKFQPKRIATLLKMAEFQTIIKRFKAAHYNLNAILELDPTNAEALFMKGYLYSEENLPLRAVESLQQAIQSDPDLVDGHLLLGQLFEQAGNPMARKFYENAIRVAPENAEAKMSLANYYWMADNYSMALSLYENLLSDSPDFARAYYNKGLIYLELDSLTEAYQVLGKAAALEPSFILAHYYLAETKILLEDYVSAKIHLEEAVRLSPTDQKIVTKLQDVSDKIEQLKLN